MNVFSGQRPLSKRLLGFFAVLIAATAAVAIIGLLLGMLGTFSIKGFPNLDWEFLSEFPRNNNTEGGIWPALAGTTLLVLLMTILGVPIGTATAIYLTEYARQNSFFARSVRFAVNTLAGVPSIVFGLFGVGFFIQFLGGGVERITGNASFGDGSLLWSAATLAVLTLPVVIVAVEEALRAVPRDLREASLALGATRWQTIRNVVLPNSVTGILTGSILAVGRGAGEVAAILFVGVTYSSEVLPGSVTDKFMHLGYHLYVLATQSPDVDKALPLQYATTLVLLGLTFLLNFTAIFIRSRLRKN
ncbi:MAG TPA: phosphate ABC transporter permease PtsA [Bacteroidetes bacterium]|nr:phosphate ABC transporter permease PtsA [Bacteroidota bacterium]HRK05534.1 phosphate ABC transporter permease PstA [Chlorobiota bacterium]